jgi:flavin reductase (DIM6/NTAB) family NADH-FMN oxidoreductase RutF
VTIDGNQLRRVGGCFATGVTVVTTKIGDETHGMTANAFSTLSLDPPLILVCVDHTARTHEFIPLAQAFAVNVLPADQKDLSDFFAKRLAPHPDHELEGIPYNIGQTGSPLLEGSFAYFDCKLYATHPGGDHTIYLGEVVDVSDSEDAEPLLFWRGKYRKVDPEPVA